MTELAIVPKKECAVAVQYGIFYLINKGDYKPLTKEEALKIFNEESADWTMAAYNAMERYLREPKINLDSLVITV